MGQYTTNGFIYAPALGESGETAKALFDAGLTQVDTRLGNEIWMGDPLYGTTFDEAVTAIDTTEAILRVAPGTVNITDDLEVPANITLVPERGVSFAITAGKILTIQNMQAGLYPLFSGAGTVRFGNGVPEVYPEWWGAVADNATDSGDAIRAAATCENAEGTSYKNVKYGPGIYLVNTGQVLQDAADKMSGQVISGSGRGINERTFRNASAWMGGTIIKFADTTIDALWKVDTKDNYASWTFKDLSLQGPGSGAGTSIHGLFITNSDTVNYFRSLYHSSISNVIVADVSGDGFRAYRFWSSKVSECAAMHCGGNGFLMPGFGTTYSNIGVNYDIAGVSMWIIDYTPIVRAFNTDECATGMKYGLEAADRTAQNIPTWVWTDHGVATTEPISCYPSIDFANIEPCTSAGIVMATGSNFIRGDNISIVAKAASTVAAAIQMTAPYRHTGEMRNLYINHGVTHGTITVDFNVDAAAGFSPPAGLYVHYSSDTTYRWNSALVTGANSYAIIPVQSNTTYSGSIATMQIPSLKIGGLGGTAYMDISYVPKTVTLSGATTTEAAAIPSGCYIIGIVGRVTTAITGTGVTSYDVGVSGATDRYGNNLALALNSSWPFGSGTGTAGVIYGADTDLVFTANGGNFAGGVVDIRIFYMRGIPREAV